MITLEGAYDIHVHAAPELFPRIGDADETCRGQDRTSSDEYVDVVPHCGRRRGTPEGVQRSRSRISTPSPAPSDVAYGPTCQGDPVKF